MPIYLVQHAKSLAKELDPEKGISEQGIADTERIAGVASGYQVKVQKIQHSGKKRAHQTAEILTKALVPEKGSEAGVGLNPMDDIEETAKNLDPSSNLMIVGHLPHLERLASWLITGKADHPVFRFQNSGIVCLDKEAEEDYWHIKWTLMPTIG